MIWTLLQPTGFASAINELGQSAPRLGGARMASVYENGGGWREIEDGSKVQTGKIWFSGHIEDGDPELLKYWPDEQGELRSVDGDVLESLSGMDVVRSGWRGRRTSTSMRRRCGGLVPSTTNCRSGPLHVRRVHPRPGQSCRERILESRDRAKDGTNSSHRCCDRRAD